ncbi:MAG TPA: hypothetical protein VKG01_09120 [Thermoanaerobaculia bacterium]|nr:hypothetical protein [Thermoanaerobaculia bacterium]
MALNNLARIAYFLFGVLYVVIGIGSILLPTAWLPNGLAAGILPEPISNPFLGHLLQEFGTVVLALGFVFLWQASRKETSRTFYWAMTLYFFLDALIHWVGPTGFIGSWSRGIVNSIPLAIMVLVGFLESRAPGPQVNRGTA